MICYVFLQLKDRQKKKRGTKCICVDSEGVASLDDLSAPGPGNEEFLEEDKEPSSKKVHNLIFYFIATCC